MATQGARAAAAAVHLFTATGAVLALLMVHFSYQGEVRDGAVAVPRRDGRRRDRRDAGPAVPGQGACCPGFDGALLDNIVDYMTYAFAPMVLLWANGYLPGRRRRRRRAPPSRWSRRATSSAGPTRRPTTTSSSASRRYWNIVAFYVVVWELSTVATTVLLLLLAVLVFVPIKYLYPSRTEKLWYVNMTLATVWLVLWARDHRKPPRRAAWPSSRCRSCTSSTTWPVSLWLTFSPASAHPASRSAAESAARAVQLLDSPARGTHHRHRRTPQRGQVDPLQRADQERRARGELPVRDDRAERRRGRRPRRPAAAARRALRVRARSLPATVEFVDIAGIVRGASEGEGLGNKFLSHIRESAAICQVTRVFRDEDVTHVDGEVDPANDIATIQTELILADLQTVEKAIPRLEKEARRQQGARRRPRGRAGGAGRARGRYADHRRPKIDRALLRELSLLTAKPYIYVFNCDADELGRRGPQGADAGARRAGRGDLPRRQVRVRAGRARRRRRGPRDARRDGRRRARPRRPRPGRLRHPRPADLPDRRPQGVPRLDDPQGRHRPRGRRRHPHRLPARLHQGRDRLVRRPDRPPARCSRPRRPARSAWRARTT